MPPMVAGSASILGHSSLGLSRIFLTRSTSEGGTETGSPGFIAFLPCVMKRGEWTMFSDELQRGKSRCLFSG